MLPRGQVLATGPDDTLDDQHFILDRDELVASVAHRIYKVPIATPAWTTIYRVWVTYPDMCGSSGGGATISGEFSVRLYCADDKWNVRIYNTATAAGYQFTTPVAGATGVWCGSSGAPGWTSLTLAADGSENELALQVQCPNEDSGDLLYIYGLGVYTGGA
jgi:hypothetical protein